MPTVLRSRAGPPVIMVAVRVTPCHVPLPDTVILHAAMQDVKDFLAAKRGGPYYHAEVATTKTTDELLRLAAQTFGRLGGRARAKALSPERRKAIARGAAEARARALSPERRRAIAQKAVRARLSKKK